MEKMKLKISKWKNEKGSVVLFVVCAMIFFITIALSSYIYNANKRMMQERQLAAIKREYEVSKEEEQQKYEEIITGSDGKIYDGLSYYFFGEKTVLKVK